MFLDLEKKPTNTVICSSGTFGVFCDAKVVGGRGVGTSSFWIMTMIEVYINNIQ